jgi:glutamyl-tRNA synthetase
MTVRVRFAPAPTGPLHVGGARTALYNWLFARNRGGVMILRSDDTDRERSRDEFYRDIVDGLRWLGIDWDEGIEVGGPHGTYRQSDRLARYREVAEGLVAAGLAYYDLATPEQVEDSRAAAWGERRSPVYTGRFRATEDEAAKLTASGDRAPIRFAVPRPGETVFDDVVRGHLRFDHADVDDFVILRSDGTPTYHLASTVDDVDYGVTHVVRGEDLLPSTPKHLLLAAAMGGEPARYAHLSLLSGPDGRKLSKRHGDTALRAYREQGFVAAAVRNYLAILGWSPGADEEIVPLETMVERFDLAHVSRNPAVFDPTKLEWMNGVYLRAMDPRALVAAAAPLVESGLGRSLGEDETDLLVRVAPLVQERIKRLTELPGQVAFLFVDAVAYDDASWERVMVGPAAEVLARARADLSGVREWTAAAVEAALRGLLDDLGLGASKGLQPVRVAVTGSSVSPPLFESLEALGRERTLARLDAALARLSG